MTLSCQVKLYFVGGSRCPIWALHAIFSNAWRAQSTFALEATILDNLNDDGDDDGEMEAFCF